MLPSLEEIETAAFSENIAANRAPAEAVNGLGKHFYLALFLGHFFAGEEKVPCIICSHMREIPRKSWELGYAWIFSVYLLVVFRYLPAYTMDDDCWRMLLPIVSEQTLYKTRVDALCSCTYVAFLHIHIVRD